MFKTTEQVARLIEFEFKPETGDRLGYQGRGFIAADLERIFMCEDQQANEATRTLLRVLGHLNLMAEGTQLLVSHVTPPLDI